jgi:hypothetical protein
MKAILELDRVVVGDRRPCWRLALSVKSEEVVSGVIAGKIEDF